MAEVSNVRLVRCPKCQNLLPELPDYPLYKCGGCGAVLRAKKKVGGSGGLAERPVKEREGEGFEKLETLSEKENGGGLRIASETERDSDGAVIARRKGRFRAMDLVGSSLPRKENKEVSADDGDRNAMEQNPGFQSGEEKGSGFASKCRQPLKHLVENRVLRDGMDKSQSVNSSREVGGREISGLYKSSAASLRPRLATDRWNLGRDGSMANDHNKVSTFAYPDEGPSNYHLSSSAYGHGKPGKHHGNLNLDVPNRVAYMEKDRAEMLRMLDELREQFRRSYSVAEKQMERTPVAGRTFSSDPYCAREICNVSMRTSALEKHVMEPSFFRKYNQENTCTNGHDMDMQNIRFPLTRASKEIPAYEDPFHLGGHSRQQPYQFWQQPTHGYFSGQCMDFNHTSMAPYSNETYQQSACSCFHCHNRNQHAPSQFSPNAFGNRRLTKEPTFSTFNGKVNPATYGPQNYPSHSNPPAWPSRDPGLQVRWPSDIDSDIDGFKWTRRRRVVPTLKNRRICHPIAGGVPFITCICFELLKLPKKLKVREKNQHKLQCGSCSTVLSLEIQNKRLIISVIAENEPISAGADTGSSEVSKEVHLSSGSHSNASGINCSIDFDNHGYNFQSADFKENIQSEDQRLNLSVPENRQGLTSPSSISSEVKDSLDNMNVQRDIACFVDQPTKHDVYPTFAGSPGQEISGDVFSNCAVNSSSKGNRSKRTDQEKVVLHKSASRQNSVKDASVSAEVEVSFNDYLNTGLSEDSVGVNKDESLVRINKENESFLTSFIKKRFRNFSKSNQRLDDEKANVLVNGKVIPDRLVKKAEKLAGPIQPGHYWYDFRAGFWGVMGQPCLGVIPPSIEEFNYPMPEDCAAGETHVFVNGRELHQNDLDLLANRGLPTTREKFYSIESTGRVVDEDSGEELLSLGTLAPTTF